MASKNLYLNIVIRCLLIALASMVTGWLVFHLHYYVLAAVSLVFLVVFLISLIRFLNATNARIAAFFEAVSNEDSTLRFPRRSGNRILDELNQSLEKLNGLIGKVLIRQQQQEQYFQTILEHVPVGVITFNENGLIFLANSAAKHILNYEHLNHIRQLERIDPLLQRTFNEIRPGDRKLIRISIKKEDVQLSLKSTVFISSDERLQLVTIQDIRTEMEKTEQDSWIKLIRVLTHEIMNTVAPITSMSEILLKNFANLSGNTLPDKTLNSTVKGLEVINDRGNGLISFVDSYRKFTRLPEPVKKPIQVRKLFEQVITLVSMDIEKKGIRVEAKVEPEELEVLADEKQISQVLINLCKNSLEALRTEALNAASLNSTKNARINLNGFINNQGRPQLEVSDNGIGIPEENLDKIFVPFFTTRESGSGVGLSLSRQIMQMHGGSLTANSVPGKRTSMIMVF